MPDLIEARSGLDKLLDEVRELKVNNDKLRQAAEFALAELEQAPCRDNRDRTYCLKCRAQEILRQALGGGKG